MLRTSLLCIAALVAVLTLAVADAAGPAFWSIAAVPAERMPVPPAPVTAPAWLVTGRLVRIDAAANTVTLRHPRLPIGIPPGTTVFRVAEPMFIDQMKSARTVRFSAARIDGTPTITHLEVPARKSRT
jgi:Cu/Ag efflux protein CusF